MIKKFKDFINENALYASSDFISLINVLSKTSPVAYALYKLFRKDVDNLTVNYLSLDKSKVDEIEFSQNSKINSFFNSKGDIYQRTNRHCLHLTVEPIKYFEIPEGAILGITTIGKFYELVSKNGSMSLFRDLDDENKYYVCDGSECFIKENKDYVFLDKFYTKYRSNIKVGRAVRAILKSANE